MALCRRSTHVSTPPTLKRKPTMMRIFTNAGRMTAVSIWDVVRVIVLSEGGTVLALADDTVRSFDPHPYAEVAAEVALGVMPAVSSRTEAFGTGICGTMFEGSF